MDKQLKDTFILRSSWYEGIKELPLEARGEMLDAIFKLHIDGTIHQFNNPIAKMLFNMIKESMEVTANSYYKAVEDGKKGGAPKGNNNAKKKQPPVDLENNPPLNQEQPTLVLETTPPCFENNLIGIDIVSDIVSDIDTDTAIGSDTASVIETQTVIGSDTASVFETQTVIGSDTDTIIEYDISSVIETPTVIGSKSGKVKLSDFNKQMLIQAVSNKIPYPLCNIALRLIQGDRLTKDEKITLTNAKNKFDKIGDMKPYLENLV